MDRHSPKKQASLCKMKQLAKPWITKGLLTSIKVKQKMYHTHFLCNDPAKISKYKQYSNSLNRIKTKAKNEYYRQHFQLYKDNLKDTWKLIGTLIKRKRKGQSCPSRIIQGRASPGPQSPFARPSSRLLYLFVCDFICCCGNLYRALMKASK